MRFLPGRRALAAVLVPLALVGVSACGNDSPKGGDPAGGNPFAQKTAQPTSEPTTAPTGDPTTEPGVPDPTTDPTAPVGGREPGAEVPVEDFRTILESGISASSTAALDMSIEAVGSTITATGQQDSTDPANPKMSISMDMEVSGQSMTMEMILLDGTMYMKAPELTKDEKWLKMSIEEFAASSGQENMMDQLDQQKSLENLVPGIDQVTYVGPTERNGASVDEYSVVVRTADVESLQGQPGLPDEVTYALFMDDQTRITGMDVEIGTLGTTSVNMTNLGEPVQIEAPGASEISDLDLSSLGAS